MHVYGMRFMMGSHVLALIAILLLSFVTLPETSLADGYYFKERNGVAHYTNLDPEDRSFKQMSNPWGTFKGSRRTIKRSKTRVGSFKYSQDYDKHINKTARTFGVDPMLVKAIIKVESNFNPDAVSPKGAMGVMQLMPQTAINNGVTNPYDPHQNIQGGVRYFSKLMKMFNNNTTLALAGYNAGENAVIKYGYKIPPYPETINYVDKVYIHYDKLRNSKTKRNTDSMIAESNYIKSNKENIKSDKEKKKSFMYVETLDTKAVAANKTTKQKPAVQTQVSKSSQSTQQKTTETTITKNPDGRFTVQIASFPKLHHAQEMEENLKSKNHPAYIQKVEIPGKGTWYRVRVGKFTNKNDARQFGQDIKTKEPSINSVLVTSL